MHPGRRSLLLLALLPLLPHAAFALDPPAPPPTLARSPSLPTCTPTDAPEGIHVVPGREGSPLFSVRVEGGCMSPVAELYGLGEVNPWGFPVTVTASFGADHMTVEGEEIRALFHNFTLTYTTDEGVIFLTESHTWSPGPPTTPTSPPVALVPPGGELR